VITADRNRGKGSAVRLGMLEAAGDYILFTDSDLAYGVDSCVDMLRQISDTKGDVLIGSRARHKEGYAGYTFIRKLASKVYMSLLAVSAGFSYSDNEKDRHKMPQGENTAEAYSRGYDRPSLGF